MAVDILRKPLACIFHPQVWSTVFLRTDDGHLPCWCHLHVQQQDSLLYSCIYTKLYCIMTHWIPILYRSYCSQNKLNWYFNEKHGPESLLRNPKVAQLVKIFLYSYGTQHFITVFTQSVPQNCILSHIHPL